jgi:hypothetical protein
MDKIKYWLSDGYELGHMLPKEFEQNTNVSNTMKKTAMAGVSSTWQQG